MSTCTCMLDCVCAFICMCDETMLVSLKLVCRYSIVYKEVPWSWSHSTRRSIWTALRESLACSWCIFPRSLTFSAHPICTSSILGFFFVHLCFISQFQILSLSSPSSSSHPLFYSLSSVMVGEKLNRVWDEASDPIPTDRPDSLGGLREMDQCLLPEKAFHSQVRVIHK